MVNSTWVRVVVYPKLYRGGKKELGNKVRELREERGMTQKQLAMKAGVAVRTIHGTEKGSTTSRQETKRKLLAALGYSLNGGDDFKQARKDVFGE